MKKQYNNFVEVERMLQFLNIQEITTKRQKANGTREFKLPINDPYGDVIHVASYSTGYVRRTKTGGSSSDWQLNKTKKSKRYVNMNDEDNGRPVIRTFDSIERILVPYEQDRLEYLISYCLKNYYIGQANMLSSGKFIPKWKHKLLLDADNLTQDKYNEAYNQGYEAGSNPEVKVIVNGHRYNITP